MLPKGSLLDIEPMTRLDRSPLRRREDLQGHGSATAHHGEILQGMFEQSDGSLHRALVTLPCDLFGSEATFAPSSDAPVVVEPAWKCKARQAAELTLAACGLAEWGGRLTIRSNVPLGWGLGSSTCDVTASIRAIADAFDLDLAPRSIAALAVQAEQASDSIMFSDAAVLFAHRSGIVLESFDQPLPPLDIVGFNTDATGAGIDTLDFAPAQYSAEDVESFRPLVGLLRRAIYDQDPRLVGLVASASARINQRYLPKPQFDRIEEAAAATGAVGLQVSHSGTIVGLIFDPRGDDAHRNIQAAQALIAEMGFGASWHIQTQAANRPGREERIRR